MTLEATSILLIVLQAAWVFQAWWCWYNVRRFHRRLKLHAGRIEVRGDMPGLPTILIVPVKGVDEHFEQHVEGLFNQVRVDYRLVFVIESEQDPAYPVLSQLIERLPRTDRLKRVDLIDAGLAESGGQKVHNQLQGLKTIGEDEIDGVVVFADADAIPDENWLAAISVSAVKKRFAGATGYRWFIPVDEHPASQFASVINASAATLLGPASRNHAWGGAMAMSLQTMRECRLIDHLEGALSDDYQFTRAMSRSGKQLYFMSQAMVASPLRMTWSKLFEFARRQYIITRIYAPWIWVRVLGVLSLYLAGWISAIAGLVTGMGWALIPIGLVCAFDALRARARRRVVEALFGEATARSMDRVFLLELLATPLWMGLHWLIVVSTMFGRRIRWAGIDYLIRGRQDVIIERRDPPAATG